MPPRGGRTPRTVPPGRGVVAVVLAAGLSSRMGRPKPLVSLGGRTLLERTLRILRETEVGRIVVVLGSHADEVRRAVDLEGTLVVENPHFADGMSGSLRAGLAALPRGASHVLTVLADQPFVAPSSIDRLIAAARAGDGRIYLPTFRGVAGNPVLFDASLVAEAETIEGDQGCRAMFPGHAAELREVPVDDPGILVDVDTPQELGALERAFRDGAPVAEAVLRLAGPRLALHASPAEHPVPRRLWRPPDVLALAASLRAERLPFALATVVRAVRPTSGRPGYRAVIRPDGRATGWVGGNCTEHLLIAEAQAALREGTPRLLRVSPGGARGRPEEGVVERPMVCESGGTVEIYIEPNVPKPELVLVGDSPVATTLATLGPVLGYRVVLVAPGASARDLPEVDELVERVEELPSHVGPASYVVVASMGKYDGTALALIAKGPAAFVGLVASRTRARAVFAGLREDGLSAAEIARIRNPVGLDVGAETPEEIALSILAEITKVRRTERPAVADARTPQEPLTTPAPAIDPVCAMEVERSSPLHAEHAGTTYYFCSEGCRRKFARSPRKFLATPGAPG